MRYQANIEEEKELSYVGSDGHDKSVKLEPGGFYHLPEESGVIKHMVITKVLVIPNETDTPTPNCANATGKSEGATTEDVDPSEGLRMTDAEDAVVEAKSEVVTDRVPVDDEQPE